MRLRSSRKGHSKKPFWYPTLSNSTIEENNAPDAIIGTLRVVDADNVDITYSIVGGDSNYFNINGNELRASSQFNFETKSTYQVIIKASDSNGLTYEDSFSITITNQNEAPTDIFLSNNSITEYNAINAEIGSLSVSKPSAQPVTYTVIGGDVSAFNINGDKLRAAISYTYANKNIYSVTIRADSGSEYFDKTFNISVIDYSYTYNGRAVNSSTGAGVSGATISFSASNGSPAIATATSDSGGYYSVTLEYSGSYYVTVSANQYDTWSGTLNTASVFSTSLTPKSAVVVKASGFQGISGSYGISPIYVGDSDDSSYRFNLPISFIFSGIEYGNGSNGSLHFGTNGYITFGTGSNVYSNISASVPGRGILFNVKDNRLYELYGGSKTQNGMTYYHIYSRMTSYSNTSDVLITEILFFPGNRVTINYGATTNTSGIAGISNGSSYVASWGPYQNRSYALEGNADGSSWTVTSGAYWQIL